MKRMLKQTYSARLLTGLSLCGLIGGVVCLSGCASSEPASEPTVRKQPSQMTNEQTAQFAEERYLIGPMAADTFGYRIDWQRSPSTDKVEHLALGGDSVYALDSANFLARVRASDGVRIWRVPIVEAIEEVYGIAYVPMNDRVYVVTGNSLIELEGSTGNQLSKQNLGKVAATGPAVYDQFVLYGARNGQLVWHSFLAQYMWKSYQLAPSVLVTPVISDDRQFVVCAGSDGHLMILRVNSATQMWNTQLLDEIVSPPAAVNGVVYVSSLDQHLRAYDIETGRRLWSKLTRGHLNTSPVVIDDRVYQEVPGKGLLCMEAVPFDAPGGVEVWSADNVNGYVVTRRKGDLVVWDDDSRMLSVVDGKLGAVVSQVELPKVKRIQTSSHDEGVLYAISDTGVVERLVPRGG